MKYDFCIYIIRMYEMLSKILSSNTTGCHLVISNFNIFPLNTSQKFLLTRLCPKGNTPTHLIQNWKGAYSKYSILNDIFIQTCTISSSHNYSWTRLWYLIDLNQMTLAQSHDIPSGYKPNMCMYHFNSIKLHTAQTTSFSNDLDIKTQCKIWAYFILTRSKVVGRTDKWTWWFLYVPKLCGAYSHKDWSCR